MAQRRMFSKKITETDIFLDMPMSTQCLYFHLNMAADEKGMLKNAKSICRKIGGDLESLSTLALSGYIEQVDEMKVAIVHWDINNGIGENSKKRLSYKYRKWRQGILERDGHKCTNCDSKENLNVHHIKLFSKHEELRYDNDNATTLCEICHKEIHKEDRKNGWR